MRTYKKWNKILTKDFLLKEIKNNKSASEIAKEIGCSRNRIAEYIKKYDIPYIPQKHKDIKGKTFGRLTAIEYLGKVDGYRTHLWKCVCGCNNKTEVLVPIHDLVRGHKKSCGCLLNETGIKNGRKVIVNLIGKNFGNLTVLKESKNRRNSGSVLWICQCNCEDKTIIEVPSPHLINGNTLSCGCLSSSYGEIYIENLLKKVDLIYEKQKKFTKCRLKNLLSFDFYLPLLNICIEYQGQQHYEPVEYYGGKKRFELQIKRDNIKKEYCKNNNIKLIEIPYWYKEENIKNIILNISNMDSK